MRWSAVKKKGCVVRAALEERRKKLVFFLTSSSECRLVKDAKNGTSTCSGDPP